MHAQQVLDRKYPPTNVRKAFLKNRNNQQTNHTHQKRPDTTGYQYLQEHPS